MLALPAPIPEDSRYPPQALNNSLTLTIEDPSKFDAAQAAARSYNELMDVFSLHQFIIRKGKVLDQTPEFQSFKRTYIGQWGSVSYIIHLLEKFLSTYSIDMAYIDGKALVQLSEAQTPDMRKPTNVQLYDCIANKDDVSKIIKIPSRMFKGPRGPELAAVTIQKNWRMYKAFTAYSQLKFLMEKAKIIQRRFRLFLFQKQTKARVEEINN
jgi:IQ domain-containing protein H